MMYELTPIPIHDLYDNPDSIIPFIFHSIKEGFTLKKIDDILIDKFNNKTVEELLSLKFDYRDILLWKKNISEEEKHKIEMILELRK